MKVLYLCNDLSLSGSPFGITTEAIELTKRGHQIIVVSRGGPLSTKLASFGIKTVETDMPCLGSGKLLVRDLDYILNGMVNFLKLIRNNRLMKCYVLISNLVKQEDIDVIYAHQPGGAFLAYLISKKLGIPYCIRVQHIIANEFPPPWYRAVVNASYKVSVITDEVANHLKLVYGISSQKIIKISTPVDLDLLHDAIPPELPDEEVQFIHGAWPLIVSISTLGDAKVKPAECLIRSMPKIVVTLPQARALVIGEGSNFERLRELAKEQALRTGKTLVKLVGAKQDVRPYLHRADVVVGVGRVAMEALSYSKPLICASQMGFAGLFTQESAEEIAAFNFSGRNKKEEPTPDLLKETIVDLFSFSEDKLNSIRNFSSSFFRRYFDVNSSVNLTVKLLTEAFLSKSSGLLQKSLQ